MTIKDTGLLSWGPDAAISEYPSNGDLLVWNDALQKWLPTAGGSGSDLLNVGNFSMAYTGSPTGTFSYGIANRGDNCYVAQRDLALVGLSASIATVPGVGQSFSLNIAIEDPAGVAPTVNVIGALIFDDTTLDAVTVTLSPEVSIPAGYKVRLNYGLSGGLTPTVAADLMLRVV